MFNNKIVYLRQDQIRLNHLPLPKNLFIQNSAEFQNNYLGWSFYTRWGPDVLPFGCEREFWKQVLPDTVIPEATQSWKGSFGDLMDQRAFRLRESCWDRTWYVDWSGGIDSTAILTAILKNFVTADFENICIVCNQFSVMENPRFYFDHIVPNFRVIDSMSLDNESSIPDNIYRITGAPADMLQGAVRAVEAHQNGLDLKQSWRHNPDPLLFWLTKITNKTTAHWIYQVVQQNLQHDPWAVDTYADWFWWINFNFKWIQQLCCHVHRIRLIDIKEYINSLVHWYSSSDFQLWSIHEARYDLAIDNIGDYKKIAKDYIFAFDKNVYYHKFKMKGNSASRFSDWCLSNSDTGCLGFTNHWEPVYEYQDNEFEMVQQHINPTALVSN